MNNKTGSESDDGDGNDVAAKSDRKHNSLAVLRVFLNVRNGSWIFTVFFIGLCNNGFIWGFLFWHLDNLGMEAVNISARENTETHADAGACILMIQLNLNGKGAKCNRT